MKNSFTCIFLIIFYCFFLRVPSTAQPAKQKSGVEMYTSEEKPWIWWFWLGNIVDEKGIDQQLESFRKSGFGGVNIICTYGVKGYELRQIRYRSPEWYNILQYTIKKAHNLDMGVDLALTSAWPFGGPQVTKQMGAKHLLSHKSYIANGKFEKQLIDNSVEEFLISAIAFSEKGDYLDLTALVKNGFLETQLPSGIWNVEVVSGSNTGQMVKRSSPGGEGYVVDHFSKEAVTAYLADFDKDIKYMKGIRSVFNDSYEVYGADFTPELVDKFEEWRGYSPLPYMHLLFDTTGSEISKRFLCDYRTTISDLLQKNFMGVWVDWSHKNGFTVTEQAHGAPANTLDLYSSADIAMSESFGPSCFNIPGVRIDPDTKRARYKWPDKLFLKFSSSAANIQGNHLISCETATWLTNHFRLALSQLKPQIDEIFISGINHIQLISATNVPADAPYPGWVFYPAPDFGPRSALYDYLPNLSEYITRSQHFLQNSTPDNDVLIYFPVYDYFNDVTRDLGVLGMMDHIPTKWGDTLPFTKTSKVLWENGFSFDYITDKQISELSTEGKKMICRGKLKYSAIVIPACKRIPIETFDKLLEMAKLGANIIFDTQLPYDVPGLYQLEHRLKLLNIKSQSIINYPTVVVSSDLKKSLIKVGCKKEYFAENNLEYIRKNYVNGKLYYIANQDSIFKRGFVKIASPSQLFELIDPITGISGFPRVEHRFDGDYVYLEILPGQSLILKTDIKNNNPWKYFNDGKMIVINASWTLSFEKGEPFTPNTLKTDKLISWTELTDSRSVFYNGTGIYTANFDRPKLLKNSSYIRLLFSDLRDMAEVSINGKTIGRTWSVPYIIDFDSHILKPKGNTITIRVKNLATNRIIWMDRQKLNWQESYIADPKKSHFDAADWEIVPSGIIGPVKLIGDDK
jgi:hypothetical protein